MKNLYISCPMSVTQNKLSHVANMIQDRGYSCRYDDLEFSDGVVFILNNGLFSQRRDNLSLEIYKEVKLAIKLGKPIFVAYTSKTTGATQVYEAKVDDISIGGVAGKYLPIKTSRSIESPLVESLFVEKSEANPLFTFDRRLLLMLQ